MSGTFSYLLKCNLRGSAANKVKDLAAVAARESSDFGVVHNSYEKHWYAPHFTLKYHFSADEHQAAALWTELEAFSLRTCPASGKIVGTGSFGAKVIFVEHEHSEEAANIVCELMKLLQSLEWMTWQWNDDQEQGPSLHSTIVKDDEDRAGDAIFSILQSSFGEPVSYMFDNISVERRLETDPIGYGHPRVDYDHTWKVFEFQAAQS